MSNTWNTVNGSALKVFIHTNHWTNRPNYGN